MELEPATILSMWPREAGKGFTFPGHEFHAIVGEFFNERFSRSQNSRTAKGGIGPDRFDRVDRSKAEIEALVAADHAAHLAANPLFIIKTTPTNALTVQLARGRTRPVIELGRFVGKRTEKKSFFLLNGDGFENTTLQRIQNELRSTATNQFRTISRRLIVPYAALESAGLDYDSIIPFHVSQDGQRHNVVVVPSVPEKIGREHISDYYGAPDQVRKEFFYNGRSYRTQGGYYSRVAPGVEKPDLFAIQHYAIMHRPEFGNSETWHAIEMESTKKWTVREHVHVLGASVFSAVGRDGKRHRWLSAFDQNENPPMYFLAQLPDTGPLRYVTHAFKLLAPEIVHKARAEGRAVFRQGDIFAVETNLTDEDFASEKIAERQQVFTGFTFIQAEGGGSTTEIPRLNEEARADLKLRRRIMIYGTGHTASRVVQTKDRGTFIQGTMHHDPILENIRAGREPEHAPMVLSPDKWFLCVRNAVPRLQTTPPEGESSADTSNESVPRVHGDQRQRRRRVPERRLQSSAAGSNR